MSRHPSSDGGRNRDHLATLVPEPDNPYDANAVRVIIVADSFGHVGYLAREDAVAHRPVINRLASLGMVTACRASLSGGWERAGTTVGRSVSGLAWEGPPT